MRRVEVVIAARNEEQRIGNTLASLRAQTLPPYRVIVVNDGSTDSTRSLALSLGSEVVDLPFHETSYLGRPELSNVFNAGLRMVSSGAEYVMILGADHPLPPDYTARLLQAMDAEGVVAGSGGIMGERADPEVPRNSGMLVKAEVWRSVNGLQYPPVWGYEGWLLFRLRKEGFKVKLYPNITSNMARKTRIKGGNDGRAMFALGYDWKYVFGRFVLNLAQPSDSLAMLIGFLGCYFDPQWRQNRTDVADWVNQKQKAVLRARVRRVLSRAKS